MSVEMIFPGVYEYKPDVESARDDFERHEALVKFSGIPPSFVHDCRFSKFEMVEGREEGFEAACRFARGEVAPPLLFFYGPPGRSKTHLAAAIGLSFLAQLKSVLFYHVGDLIDDLMAGIRIERSALPGERDPQMASAIMERCKAVQLLILDDMGLGDEGVWAWAKLDTIVNHRYDFQLPTVITANTLEISDRIRDRCRHGLVVRLSGESYREIIARRKAEKEPAKKARKGKTNASDS